MRTRWIVGVALAVGACGPVDTDPAARLNDALQAIGGLDFAGGEGFRVHASGTLDKVVEGQGIAPGRSSEGPYRETVAVRPADGAVAWSYREDRFDGTYETLSWIFPTDSQQVLVLPDLALVIPQVGGAYAERRRGIERRIPHLLLAEMLDTPEALTAFDGGNAVSGVLHSGDTVTVGFDGDGLPRRATFDEVIPAQGRRSVAWRYDDWRDVPEAGRFPHAYGIDVGDRRYTDLRVDSIRPGIASALEPPAGLRVLDERRVTEPEGEEPAPPASIAPPLPDVQEVGPGLYVVPGVRGGFDPMVIAFDSFLVAIDAPASFPLLGEIPVGETDPGPNLSWVSERYVDAITERFPDRPIRYVVLSHFHEDHGGGLRAFVAAGATVLADGSARTAIEALLEIPDTIADDRYAREPGPLRFEPVDSTRVIEQGGRRLEVVNTGPNPHHQGMLIPWLPAEGVMFVSDMLTPERLDVYPRESHAALDRWFVGWLDRSGLAPEFVYSMHGASPASPAHLERVRAGGG